MLAPCMNLSIDSLGKALCKTKGNSKPLHHHIYGELKYYKLFIFNMQEFI